MEKSRRRLLLMLVATACAGLPGKLLAMQAPRKPIPFPTPPQGESKYPAETQGDRSESDAKAAKRAELEQNQEKFREGVNYLYKLVSDLKAEMDRTATENVFSMNLYKKTVEIEKLAKELKKRAKGN